MKQESIRFEKTGMSVARQIIPASTYMVTRRTTGRQFLLKPVPLVKQTFGYCLGYAANRYNVRIHAYCVMTNHYHIVLTDPDGRLPDFLSWFNEFVARALNRLWDRAESFWAPGSYSAIRLETADDVIEKMVYTLTNPVKALLVMKSSNWPGASSRLVAFDSKTTFKRPSMFFSRKGAMPASSTLRLETPMQFVGRETELRVQINERISEVEADFKRSAQKQRASFAGAGAVLKVQHFDRPRTPTISKSINPHVASRNPIALKVALLRLKAFRHEYIQARERFRAGDASVIFPYGTFAMRRFARIEDEPPPGIDEWHQ